MIAAFAASAVLLAAVLPCQAAHRIAATTPDLGALCRLVGGDRAEVTVFVRPGEDAHFLEARPSMVRALSRAEALVEVGRELEVGWLPVLVGQCRNGAVLAGQPGRIVAGDVVRRLGVPQGPVDRSQGDVHRDGNPHFLGDPLCGLQVARLLRDRFGALWPAEREAFDTNVRAFERRLAVAMVGEKLAPLYDHDAEKLALLFGAGKLADVLREQGDLVDLGGWFGALLPCRGTKLVADHDLWPYVTERFGLQMIGFFEPKPGVAPTTKHLEKLVEQMREAGVKAVLTVPYFAPQHAALVERATGAPVVVMAHQCGALPGTEDHVAFVDHNVRALVRALQGTGAAGH